MLFQYSIIFKGDNTSCLNNCTTTFDTMLCAPSLRALDALPVLSAFFFILQNPDSQHNVHNVLLWPIFSSTARVDHILLHCVYFPGSITPHSPHDFSLSVSCIFWCFACPFPTHTMRSIQEMEDGRSFHPAFHLSPDFLKICTASVRA